MKKRSTPTSGKGDSADAGTTFPQVDMLRVLVDSVKDYAIITLDPGGRQHVGRKRRNDRREL